MFAPIEMNDVQGLYGGFERLEITSLAMAGRKSKSDEEIAEEEAKKEAAKQVRVGCHYVVPSRPPHTPSPPPQAKIKARKEAEALLHKQAAQQQQKLAESGGLEAALGPRKRTATEFYTDEDGASSSTGLTQELENASLSAPPPAPKKMKLKSAEHALEEENQKLKKENAELKAENEKLKQSNASLTEQLASLDQESIDGLL